MIFISSKSLKSSLASCWSASNYVENKNRKIDIKLSGKRQIRHVYL